MDNKKVTITGGEKLAKFMKDIGNQSATLEVGFFTEENAKKAFDNEYGDTERKVPSRPFMQNAIDNDEKKWNDYFADQVIANNFDIAFAMGQLGAVVAGSIVDSIKTGNYVPNTAYTLQHKNGDKPLIDTGEMWQSVSFEVHK